jgi:glycosyltransferase involved in cell wall biosynthesis
MRITIVHGFFLPIPPLAGGAMEKIWWRLAREFSARGHEVVSISRRWPGLPDAETRDGVQLLRLPGRNHSRRLPANLVLDAWWSLRVLRHLPRGDILVSNNVALPALAPRLRPGSGRLVANLNRYPKGQLRTWGRIARLQAASPAIAAAAREQAPALAPLIRVTPNPIDLTLFAPRTSTRAHDEPVVLGFTGRIHPEKGLELLARAARLLASRTDLPAWRIVLRGPDDIPRGGGGTAFVDRLRELAGPLTTDGRWSHEPPEFEPAALAPTYRACDIFVYPTQAEQGEALPVAVLEALASGLPVVATDLSCFAGYVERGRTGELVPLAAAAEQWADALANLIRDRARRERLASQARASVTALDFQIQADAMLADFSSLLSSR